MEKIVLVATSGDVGPNGMSRQPSRYTLDSLDKALAYDNVLGANLHSLLDYLNVPFTGSMEEVEVSKYSRRSSWAVQSIEINGEVLYHNEVLAAVTPQPKRKTTKRLHNFIVVGQEVIDDQLVDALELRPFWLSIETEDKLMSLAETDDDYDQYEDVSSRTALADFPSDKLIELANQHWGNDTWYRLTVVNDVFSRDHEYNPKKK